MGLIFPDPPADLPEFARTDQIDPTTGENNVVEASATQKLFGWIPFRKRPERNVMNWLHRLTYEQQNYVVNSLFPSLDGWADSAQNAINSLSTQVGDLQSQMAAVISGSIVGTVSASLKLNPQFIGRGWSGLIAGSAGTIRGPIDVGGVSDLSHYLDFDMPYVRYRDILLLTFPDPFLIGTANAGQLDGCVLEILAQPANWDLPNEQHANIRCQQFNGEINGRVIAGNGNAWDIKTADSTGVAVQNYCTDWIFQHSIAASGIMGQTITLKSKTDLGWPT